MGTLLIVDFRQVLTAGLRGVYEGLCISEGVGLLKVDKFERRLRAEKLAEGWELRVFSTLSSQRPLSAAALQRHLVVKQLIYFFFGCCFFTGAVMAGAAAGAGAALL